QKGFSPESFDAFLEIGDFIYLKSIDGVLVLDQIPVAEASLVSIDPKDGKLISYVGGMDFNKSNFDRVRLSYPQSGSSFKPFIYASALANGYNLSSLINDAPIAFEDSNLESVWKPQNYTGKFYGPTSIREALVQSINIVSIKLLREIGITKSHNYIEKFGFEKNRLPADLSLALGSGNFSPIEMVRGFSVIANGGYLVDPYFVSKIIDRNGEIIYSHEEYLQSKNISSLSAFPWLDTLEMETKRPYTLLKPINNKEKVIDERVAYLITDILQEHMKRGSAGRRSGLLNRDDIAGKTGTTNDAISTWFSGFHEDLATTVWVGTDNFSSLGKNEYGSSIALPIWVDYMNDQLQKLEVKTNSIPENMSFIKVNPDTGKPNTSNDANAYFELFLDENIIN
ncbi:penicillin-binding transpeptidase domain-containing protein, partial [Gammaproteobacteria bacterium]|nr:penicillin-binding transpeptidase domain-containing protein [Gammaproteobacteria bacterium]